MSDFDKDSVSPPLNGKLKLNLQITSVFLYNPTLKPPKSGAQDEDAV